jgi:hypothetical protein
MKAVNNLLQIFQHIVKKTSSKKTVRGHLKKYVKERGDM